MDITRLALVKPLLLGFPLPFPLLSRYRNNHPMLDTLGMDILTDSSSSLSKLHRLPNVSNVSVYKYAPKQLQQTPSLNGFIYPCLSARLLKFANSWLIKS